MYELGIFMGYSPTSTYGIRYSKYYYFDFFQVASASRSLTTIFGLLRLGFLVINKMEFLQLMNYAMTV